MVDVVFRDAPTPVVEQPKVDIPEPKKDNTRVTSLGDDNEPIEFREEGGSVVLDALNINEDIKSIPQEDKENLNLVKDYVVEILKAKGMSETVGSFKKTLDSLKGEMGLDDEAEPSKILDRIGGVVKAWRNLSFIKDTGEKKKIFLKLSTMKSSEEMNREVFKMMENYKIWL